MRIRRVGVWSAARIAACLYGGIGLVIGAIISVFALIGAGVAPMLRDRPDIPPVFMIGVGIGAVIAAPIFYGILGLIIGSISAAIYNLAAGIVGGIEVEVDTEQEHL